jgi:hypothetical protein
MKENILPFLLALAKIIMYQIPRPPRIHKLAHRRWEPAVSVAGCDPTRPPPTFVHLNKGRSGWTGGNYPQLKIILILVIFIVF